MASLPAARQHPQRQSSPEQTSDRGHSEGLLSPSRVRSVPSEDSQTTSALDGTSREAEQETPPPIKSFGSSNGNDATEKCWICFADSSEDTPTTSPWRHPCPCALVAHEECLLDWIADKEAPGRRGQSVARPKIECPQCKAEIRISRPRNYVVDAARGLERLGAKAVTPSALAVLLATVYNSSMAWGIHSVYAVFGQDDGLRILAPVLMNYARSPVEVYLARPQDAAKRLLDVILDHVVRWRLYVGLPLITPVLILSRTSFGDSVLPVLPLVFFASQAHSPDETLDFAQWPPSATLAFAVLPFIRMAYNNGYKKLFAEKEERWLRQIQPRSEEGRNDANDLENGDAAMQNDADGDNVFEVRIDGNIWEEWEDDAGVQEEGIPQPGPNAAPPLHQPPQQDDDQAQPPPNIADNRHPVPDQQPGAAAAPQQQNQQQQPEAQPERRLSFSPTAVAETVLGAMLFPTIAGLSGEALKLLLPKSWTTSALSSKGLGGQVAARGLLQARWGRSLVGGCLFVVCKDALLLYVRWKMAQMHRHRRVLDVERPKAKV